MKLKTASNTIIYAFIFLLIGLFSLVGCTQQQGAKNFGGTATIDLPAGKTLITATWKEDHFWYLVRDRKPGEIPQKYDFKESSSYGIWQGTMVLVEH